MKETKYLMSLTQSLEILTVLVLFIFKNTSTSQDLGKLEQVIVYPCIFYNIIAAPRYF